MTGGWRNQGRNGGGAAREGRLTRGGGARLRAGLVGATLLATAADAAPVQALEYQCEFRGAVRRVELARAPGGLPCEVVYWKDTERPGRRDVLWNAESSVGFCREKAEDLVRRLERGGWSCRADQGLEQARAAPVARPAPPPPRPEAARPARDDTALRRAIERDLARLNQVERASGRFEAVSDAMGDLDDDGVEDAAVVVSYRNGAAMPLQFLLVYLARGQTFVPVAKANVSTGARLGEGRVERITDGMVHLRLPLFAPDDDPCCPSEVRSATFELQAGRLVRTGGDALASNGGRGPATN